MKEMFIEKGIFFFKEKNANKTTSSPPQNIFLEKKYSPAAAGFPEGWPVTFTSHSDRYSFFLGITILT